MVGWVCWCWVVDDMISGDYDGEDDDELVAVIKVLHRT